MSLKICSLASGSKGNCCYVSDGKTDIVIDMGISATRAEKCLSVLGADPDGIKIIITHSHSDHINGLKNFCKKHPTARVICQRESATAVARATGVMPAVAPRSYLAGTVRVIAMPASHDVPCFGYVLSDGANRVSVMTDIGKIEKNQLDELVSCNIVMLEANHNMDMLFANPHYTQMLKARIASSHGHLSNADCASACAYLAAHGVKNFILAHLSEENNTPRTALDEVRRAIADAGVDGVNIIAAEQNAMTGLFEVC